MKTDNSSTPSPAMNTASPTDRRITCVGCGSAKHPNADHCPECGGTEFSQGSATSGEAAVKPWRARLKHSPDVESFAAIDAAKDAEIADLRAALAASAEQSNTPAPRELSLDIHMAVAEAVRHACTACTDAGGIADDVREAIDNISLSSIVLDVTATAVEKRRCKKCHAPRKGETCGKCGDPTFVPCAGWEEPKLPPVERIRELAREVGYAIAVHGTLERDLDLIAAPWAETAIGNKALLDHIAEGLGATVVEIERKPLGRYAATIQMDGWFKPIDISVCPAPVAERAAAPASVAVPQDANAAQLMVSLGLSWLKSYAPERLTEAGRAAEGESIRTDEFLSLLGACGVEPYDRAKIIDYVDARRKSLATPAPTAGEASAPCPHMFRTGPASEVARGGGICVVCSAELKGDAA